MRVAFQEQAHHEAGPEAVQSQVPKYMQRVFFIVTGCALVGMMLGGLFMGLFAIGMFFFLIRKFTIDFVVPIMYLRGSRCLEAWREFRQLLSGHLGNFVLYLLFQFVLGLVIGIMVLVIVVVCCPLCCFLAIPYVGTVLVLPLIVFKRAYSLHYLAQYGPSYNVFQPAPAVAQ